MPALPASAHISAHREMSQPKSSWPAKQARISVGSGASRARTGDLKRGTGLSDRIGGIPPLETRMDDVRAVMDAVDSERAALFGISEGAPMTLLFAATHPARTTAVIVYGSVPPSRAWAADIGLAARTSTAGAGSAGVGRYGRDRNRNRAKSSWLGGSRAGLRSVSGASRARTGDLLGAIRERLGTGED